MLHIRIFFTMFDACISKKRFNSPMAKGDGCHPPPPTGFSSFSREWEELFYNLNFQL